MDEIVTRHVVAWIEAVEVEPHAAQLLVAVRLERLLGFVSGAAPSLVDEARGIVGIRCKRGRELHEIVRCGAPGRQHAIDDAEASGLSHAHRQPH